MNFESILFIATLLIIISIILLKLTDKIGFPSLLIFLSIGMLAGSEGLVGLYFDDAILTQKIGIISLSYILFSGGLESDWRTIRPVLSIGSILGTLGVFLTAVAMGLFSIYVLGFSPLVGLLVGSVVSSTDAAAVFNILRTKDVGIKTNLQSIIEFESGSNDPMAVILTIGFLDLLKDPNMPYIQLFTDLVVQIGIGATLGVVFGKILFFAVNQIHLDYEGLYPVLLLAFVLLIYSVTDWVGGNPFLTIYLSGISLGNTNFVHKRSSIRFMNGISWLMQICMFLLLGLLVFPSKIFPILVSGILFSLFLIFVARPIAIFTSTLFTKLLFKEKLLLSWVGLRGAAPIILATFPFAAGVIESEQIFHIVFFTVCISLLLQGTTIPLMVRFLKLEQEPVLNKTSYPFEIENKGASDTRIEEYIVPYNSGVIGKCIFELNMPEDSLIALVLRGSSHIVPTGKTQLEGGDVLLVLVNQKNAKLIGQILSKPDIQKQKSEPSFLKRV
jgi:potassium/hydrogen antiporter